MIIVEFEGQSLLLGAPKGWNQRGGVECGFLPVRVDRAGNGEPMLVSYWRPTPEELAALNAGAHVELAVLSGSHPPVRLAVGAIVELP